MNWEDEDIASNPGFGLPKLKRQNACVVVDKSGVHRLRIHPCHCVGAPSEDVQFLGMGLFPSTLRKIKTVFTFAVLDDFRMDNLECKTAALNYYNKLKRLTSNAYPQSVPVSTTPEKCKKSTIDYMLSGPISGVTPDFTAVAKFEVQKMAWNGSYIQR